MSWEAILWIRNNVKEIKMVLKNQYIGTTTDPESSKPSKVWPNRKGRQVGLSHFANKYTELNLEFK